ncbi:MAG TPA: hypothetical protein VJ570_11880 [Holophagaceae bacterium]|nr:hypothetical protein [Holophagaceae bacterium]
MSGARVFLGLLMLLSPLAGQDRKLSVTRQLWDGPTLYTWSVAGGGVESRGPADPKVKGSPQAVVHDLPAGQRLLSVVGGEAWTVALEGEPRRPVIRRSGDWKRWERVGEVPLPEARLRGLFPLRDDRFLMLQGVVPFMQEGRASFLAILRLHEGRFQVEELVDPGVELAAAMPKGTDPAAWEPSPRPGYDEAFWEVATTYLEVVGGRPCLCMASLGKVAFFSSERGHLKKVVTLYPAVDELLPKGGRLAWPVLLMRPTPAGGLVVAARSEDAVRSARGIFPDAKPVESPQGATEEERFEAQRGAQERVRAQVWESFPEVLWYTLDPEEATFRSAAPPPGLPEKLRSLEAFRDFDFRTDPKGRVVPGGLGPGGA